MAIAAVEKNYTGMADRDAGWGGRVTLNREFREGLSETVASEQRPEVDDGGSQPTLWKRGVPSRGNSKCKGPEAGPSFGCWRMQECNRVLVSMRKAGKEAERECRTTADRECVPWGAKFQPSFCSLKLAA